MGLRSLSEQMVNTYAETVQTLARENWEALDPWTVHELALWGVKLSEGLRTQLDRTHSSEAAAVLHRLDQAIEVWVVSTDQLLEHCGPMAGQVDLVDESSHKLGTALREIRNLVKSLSRESPRLPRSIALREDPFEPMPVD
jgi:hypothetical protein